MGSIGRAVVGVGLLLAAILASAGEPAGATPVKLDIKSQPMADALNQWAQATGYQVIFPEESATAKLIAPPIRGLYVPVVALTKLLENSGLRYEYLNARTVAVKVARPDQVSPTSEQHQENGRPLVEPRAQSESPRAGEPGARSDDSGSQEASGGSSDKLAEIVVTAQKRTERLLEVPVPVTALTSQSLMENNQSRLQDYFTSVPGLNFTTDSRGTPQISIRGLFAGVNNGNPTVSVTLDDVPVGSSSTYGSNVSPVPDIDPGDLERVEVLRGPQGTLYGAASIGGLVKYVTIEPSMAGINGRFDAGGSNTYGAAQLGYMTHAAVNVPLGDTAAVRVSGFVHQDPGYIDNVETGELDINRVLVDGIHAAMLWKPSGDLSLKVSALLQDRKQHGSNQVNPALGDLKVDNIPGTGYLNEKISVFSANLAAKLGWFDLTSVTGYNTYRISDVVDITPGLGFYAGYYNVGGAREQDNGKTNKFSEELRISRQLGRAFDLLVGAFYTHEDTHYHDLWFAEEQTTGALAGNMLDGTWPTTYTEYALFTDLTVHFTQKFDVQFGGRESRNRQTYSEVDGGGYTSVFGYPTAPAPLVTPEEDTQASAFTYLVTPRYRVSDSLMIYARLASGYRAGGPNATALAFDVPTSFKPDKTFNYEVGAKGSALQDRLTFDTSVYYISWKDIQQQVTAPNNSGTYYTNAGSAKSEGVELAVEARPIRGMKVSAWMAWNNAVLTQGFPVSSLTYGASGDRLPSSARFSGNLSIDDELPLGRGFVGVIGVTESYIGERLGGFTSSAQRQVYPGYAQTNLRAGLRYDTWSFNLYANNLTYKRAFLAGGLGSFYPTWFSITTPRTIGLGLSKTFQ